MNLRNACLLYGITNREMMGEDAYLQKVEAALQGGITMLQLREKGLTDAAYIQLCRQVLPLTQKYNVPLIVNDNPMVAKLGGADGVHVGQNDMGVQSARAILGEGKIIGATAHNIEEALNASAMGADYLGVGAAFGSQTKLDAVPIEREEYRKICRKLDIPVVAIGGIEQENVAELEGRGLSGIAVIGAIFGAEDVKRATIAMKDAACRYIA